MGIQTQNNDAAKLAEYYDLRTPVVFRMPDDAIYFIKHLWNRETPSTTKVVWTGK